LISTDEYLVARLTCRGTHAGEGFGIPPTGKRVTFTAIAIAKVRDGQFIEAWNQIDLFGAYQQMGAFPAAPEAAP
jgi:predicted ester cyclase